MSATQTASKTIFNLKYCYYQVISSSLRDPKEHCAMMGRESIVEHSSQVHIMQVNPYFSRYAVFEESCYYSVSMRISKTSYLKKILGESLLN